MDKTEGYPSVVRYYVERRLSEVPACCKWKRFTPNLKSDDLVDVMDVILSTPSYHNISLTMKQYQCVICDRSHALRFCSKFILRRVEDRRLVFRDNDYQVRRCHSKLLCNKCGGQPHSMLLLVDHGRSRPRAKRQQQAL